MSWWKPKSSKQPETQHRPLYLDRPNDPEAYPDDYPYNFRSHLRPIPQFVSQGLADEAAVLSQFGFPIPTAITGLRFEPKLEPAPSYYRERERLVDVLIHLPQFRIPDCLDVKVRRNLHYIITGSQQDFEAAKTALAKHGLIYLIEHYPGVWFNRHPYHLYNEINKSEPLSYLFSANWFTAKYSRYNPGQLTQLLGLNAEDIKRLEQRIKFIETLSQKKYPFDGGLIKYSHDPERSIYHQNMSDDLLFNSKIPDDVLLADGISYKVLPNKEVAAGVTEQWLESLRPVGETVCFELRSEPDTLYYQLTVAKQDAPILEQNFELFFPGFTLLPQEPSTPRPPANRFYVTAHPSLSHEFLKTPRDFTLDPYLQLVSLLDGQRHEEGLLIIFAPLRAELMNALFKSSSSEEIKKGVEKKQTPWAMVLKLYTDDPNRIQQLKQTFLSQFETAQQKWQVSSVSASTTTTDDAIPPWNLVATSELASFVHFPGRGIQSDRLETANMTSKLPPDSYTTGTVVIGESEARGIKKPVTLPASVRDRHVYIVGKSGMGKSTLITNAVIANMRAGEGVCVIDPHGDLVATGAQPLLDYVPEHRISDTIYFNAADKEYPLALNMLSAGEGEELSLLADNLLVMFRRQSDGWGPRMEDILRATLQTLMHTHGSSFLDIKRMLHNEAFRQSVVRRLKHPMLKEFWEEDYPTNYNRKEASAPIISRVNKLLYLPQLYAMLSSPESKLDFYDIIQSKKILLVNLSSGTISEDNAQLLGSLLVTQLQMAAMRRAGVPPAQRHAFYLYVDEFQNFTTAPFEKILSEARKYRLCLTLAHQYINQLSESQRDAIFGNVGSMIMFSCGDKDAYALRYQLGSYEVQDLVNLKNFEALCRPESAKDTFAFRTIPPPKKPEGFAEAIIEHTRMTYATIIDPDQQPKESEEEPQEAPAPARITLQPVAALEKNFATKADEVLFYVNQAEYLNTDQIKQLCYGHLAESARAPMASRDLKKLIDAKRLKHEPFSRGNIYFPGRIPKATTHNLEVRNLFVKIVRSGFEIAAVNFYPALPSLTPDLAVSFLTAEGGMLKTYWEYDAGTEGIAELLKKVARYGFFKDDAVITFVFATQERLQQVKQSVKEDYINFGVLSNISLITDEVFTHAGSNIPHRLFLPPTYSFKE
jgi:hypothetical protein